MNHVQFNALPDHEKWELIFGGSAKFVAFRDNSKHKVSLFDCGEFFVEYYFFANDKKVSKMEGISLYDKRLNLYVHNTFNIDKFQNQVQQ